MSEHWFNQKKEEARGVVRLVERFFKDDEEMQRPVVKFLRWSTRSPGKREAFSEWLNAHPETPTTEEGEQEYVVNKPPAEDEVKPETGVRFNPLRIFGPGALLSDEELQELTREW